MPAAAVEASARAPMEPLQDFAAGVKQLEVRGAAGVSQAAQLSEWRPIFLGIITSFGDIRCNTEQRSSSSACAV